MAYQTGSAMNIGDILAKLAEFARPLGWTINKVSDSALYLNNSVGFWAIEFKNNMLFVIPASGVDLGRDCFNQPQSACNHTYQTIKTMTSYLEKGNYTTYDFFGTESYLHVVIQYEENKFRHFGLGSLIKEGDYVGGQYSYGTFISTSNYYRIRQSTDNILGFSAGTTQYQAVVRADGLANDLRSPWYLSAKNPYDYKDIRDAEKGNYLATLGDCVLNQNSMYNFVHPDMLLVRYSQSTFGQKLIPTPHCLIAHCRDGLFRRLGILPDRYEVMMKGLSPRQVFRVNDEKWMIIPSAQYQDKSVADDGQDNSGYQGVAYRIIE
ncbi:hypothetical protein [Pasteurella multocida]|uniref:hypothetical protein n=1 Tax=Pasteurella multocida TaxID=747 RepID=UPI0029306F9C|nr:hypothetical protein [Pasteurella multocida]WNY75976.1 hypothetical protein H2513_08855 [Pasteurella multocida]